jgi:hypothetical protein
VQASHDHMSPDSPGFGLSCLMCRLVRLTLDTETVVFGATTIATEFFIGTIGDGQTNILGITFCKVITTYAAIVMALLFVFFAFAAFVTVIHFLLKFGITVYLLTETSSHI